MAAKGRAIIDRVERDPPLSPWGWFVFILVWIIESPLGSVTSFADNPLSRTFSRQWRVHGRVIPADGSPDLDFLLSYGSEPRVRVGQVYECAYGSRVGAVSVTLITQLAGLQAEVTSPNRTLPA